MQEWEERKKIKKGLFHGLKEITVGISTMPKVMVQLAIVQFFTWVAFFSMWIYTTAAVAQNTYGTTDTTTKAFQDAGDCVGIMIMVYNGVSAIIAFLLPVIAMRTIRKHTHMISLIVGGIGLVSLLFIKDEKLLLLPMIGVGLAWASTLTMPYSILAGALPAGKMGFYMGVFNFFIVIPQLIASAILGFMVKDLFNHQSVYALVVGGISMILGGILCFIINDKHD
jgi:maltose/moltooligosaccharide transporter